MHGRGQQFETCPDGGTFGLPGGRELALGPAFGLGKHGLFLFGFLFFLTITIIVKVFPLGVQVEVQEAEVAFSSEAHSALALIDAAQAWMVEWEVPEHGFDQLGFPYVQRLLSQPQTTSRHVLGGLC